MINRSSSFQRLIDPVTPEQFFSEYYDKKPLYIPGALDKFKDVFSWTELNQLLNATSLWSGANLHMVLDNAVIQPDLFTVPGRDADGETYYRLDNPKVAGFMEQGATLNLNYIETLSSGIAGVSRALQAVFAAHVDCNLYASFKAHPAFVPHFDTMDVFALHIEGEKIWHIYENRFDTPAEMDGYVYSSLPENYHQQHKGALLETLTMTPGDFLYLPKGTYHDAIATSGACMHLTYGTIELRGKEMIDLLSNSLAHDPLFRQPMPHPDDEDAHNAHVRALAERLSQILCAPDVAPQLRDRQKSRAYWNFPGFSLPAPEFDQSFRVRKKFPRLSKSGKQFTLNFDDGKLDLTPEQAPIVDWILAADYFDMDSLANALTDTGHQQLFDVINLLVASGLIEPLSPYFTYGEV